MKAHSAGLCQCSSRTAPALSRMLTMARSFEAGTSRRVGWRDQPPSRIFTWLSAKDHRKVGSVPLSVVGGRSLSRLWACRAGFVGPMIAAPSLPRIGSGGLSPGFRRRGLGPPGPGEDCGRGGRRRPGQEVSALDLRHALPSFCVEFRWAVNP